MYALVGELSPHWIKDLPPTTKRFKGLHTDNVRE